MKVQTRVVGRHRARWRIGAQTSAFASADGEAGATQGGQVILVDSSVWMDHFRYGDAELSVLLGERRVMSHPFVVGELACGHLSKRDAVLTTLSRLPSVPVVAHDEVMAFVERHLLMARGISWIDAHLLASTLVAGRVSLWSRDQRLTAAAIDRGVAYTEGAH